jgi:hypothetical protein
MRRKRTRHSLAAIGGLAILLLLIAIGPWGQGAGAASPRAAWAQDRTGDDAPRLEANAALQSSGGPDAFGYRWEEVTFDWKDTSGGVTVTQRDNDWVGPHDIGFFFDFYGQKYRQFYLDSNGYVGFDGTQTMSYPGDAPLPLSSRPNNLIAPFWTDLDPSQGGTVRYLTVGRDTLIVEWNNVPLKGTSAPQTFQLILRETREEKYIQFQYAAVSSNSASYTAGIENADGTIGLEYRVPATGNHAVRFWLDQRPRGVLITPERQGTLAAPGTAATFRLAVRNLGTSPDVFVLSRAAYISADWGVSFYQSDGTTPLSGNETGTIPSGDQKEFVAKLQLPSSAAVGNWTRATIRAASKADPSAIHGVTVDAMVGSSFAQVYLDDESGDGTEDAENYFDVVDDGRLTVARVTTDQDDSSYAGVATTPGGRAVNVWNTTYRNDGMQVSEIQYAVLDRSGSFVRPVTRLTDNLAAGHTTYDFGPAVDVAANGRIAFAWTRQEDADKDGELGRYNVWYAVVGESGTVLKAPTALTNNGEGYPRDRAPVVAALSDGRFVLAWEHQAAPGGPVDVYDVLLDSSGAPLTASVHLTHGPGRNVTPRLAPLPGGGAAIVWAADNAAGYPEITYVTIDGQGNVTGPLAITSNGSSGAASSDADAVTLSDGRLAVAWTQHTADVRQIQYAIVPAATAASPATSPAIHTVPNALSDANVYVSLTTDDRDRLIMTWLDGHGKQYLYYALADASGTILTHATILRRTQHSELWSSWIGYGNDVLSPSGQTGVRRVYLPLLARRFPPDVLPQPVVNGGFEAGNLSGWTAGGGPGLAPQVVSSIPHSGAYAVLLGQDNAPCQSGHGGLVGSSWIYQDLPVPGVGTPELRFYYRIWTYDELNADYLDRFEVYVNGTLLDRLGNLGQAPMCDGGLLDLGWQLYTYDLSAYRGQTIRLRLVNVTYPDDWFGTWARVDDIEVRW